MTPLEALSIKYLFEHAPETLVFFAALSIVFIYVSFKVNTLINKANADREAYASRVTVLEKQLWKTITLICKCPKITKANGMWLQNPAKNGGEPPDEIEEG